MPAELRVNDSSTWRAISGVEVKDSSVWRTIQEILVNDSGTWRTVFLNTPVITGTVGQSIGGSSYLLGYRSTTGAIGTASPTSIAGNAIAWILEERSGTSPPSGVYINTYFAITSPSSLGQTYFSKLTLGGVDFPTSTGFFFYSGGISQWQWNSSQIPTDPGMVSGGTYTGTITF